MFKMGKFDGSSKLNFYTYKCIFLAVAMIKGFDEALDASLLITPIMAKTYKTTYRRGNLPGAT